MDVFAAGVQPVSSFVPATCTLPTVDQPLRLVEFEDLFASGLRGLSRPARTRLSLILDGNPDVEATARDLTARETECCSFFSFTFVSTPVASSDATPLLGLEVEVPDDQGEVLDALQTLAAAAVPRDQRSTR